MLVRAAQVTGLLYVGRNLVQVVTSYPVGYLADRFGHARMLVVGYGLGVLTAALTTLAFWLGTGSVAMLGGLFFIAGLYTTIQEALESTVSAEIVDAAQITTGYGALGAVNGAAKFVSSATVGVMWTAVSPVAGFGLAALLMGAGTIAFAAMNRTRTANPAALQT